MASEIEAIILYHGPNINPYNNVVELFARKGQRAITIRCDSPQILPLLKGQVGYLPCILMYTPSGLVILEGKDYSEFITRLQNTPPPGNGPIQYPPSRPPPGSSTPGVQSSISKEDASGMGAQGSAAATSAAIMSRPQSLETQREAGSNSPPVSGYDDVEDIVGATSVPSNIAAGSDYVQGRGDARYTQSDVRR